MTRNKRNQVQQRRRWIGYGVGIFGVANFILLLSLSTTNRTLRRRQRRGSIFSIPNNYSRTNPANGSAKQTVDQWPKQQALTIKKTKAISPLWNNHTNHNNHWILDDDDDDDGNNHNVWHSYDDARFQNRIARWRWRHHGDDHVVVLVMLAQQQQQHHSSQRQLIETVRDSLSSPLAQVVVYLHHHHHHHHHNYQFWQRRVETAAQPPSSSQLWLTREFGQAIREGQLILIVKGSDDDDAEAHRTASLRDGLALAYMLDLAYQSKSKYTMVVRAGTRLLVSNNSSSTADYVSQAINQYRSTVQESKNEHNQTIYQQRACWMGLLSSDDDDLTIGSLLETAEHASRMSLTLRSFLPYNQKTASEILTHYCRRYLWEAKVVKGPRLFSYTQPKLADTKVPLKSSVQPSSFLRASELPLFPPPWIDPSIPLGPRSDNNDSPSPYWISFAVTTMTRPIMNNTYLIQFMEELLQIVELHFHFPKNNNNVSTATSKDGGGGGGGANSVEYSAVIFLLVCGNSADEIAAHRRFLELTYGDSISRGLVRLQDSPLTSYEPKLQNMHLSYPKDSHQRRYWRSKQNLDVAATWGAVTGLSDYVMMLEDDSGFRPGFAEALQKTLRNQNRVNWDGVPFWSMIEYGFGFSGILIHASDLPVFQLVHTIFFDEQPCDLLHTELMVRTGISNKKDLLRHYGKISTLKGKVQPVWFR